MNSKPISKYKRGPKNNWRRWQWNRIVERLKVAKIRPRDALVLYLAGKENLDMPEAVRRGFRPENMIAVDLEKDVVSHLRNQGITAICQPLHEVIRNWPKNDLIHVVVADFCSGFSRATAAFANSLLDSEGLALQVVIAVNLLRGRDPFFSRSGLHKPTMHRAAWFVATLAMLPFGDREEASNFVRWMNPALDSYRSGKRLVYDSAVFNFPGGVFPRLSGRGKDEDQQVARQIAAAKAIRTMRLQGKLPRYAA